MASVVGRVIKYKKFWVRKSRTRFIKNHILNYIQQKTILLY